MIELNTGVPGAGKTLGMVQRLSKLFDRWVSNPDEVRPVFVLGIPDLNFPVSQVPLLSVQIAKAGAPSLVPDWDLMPDGSLVIIDEAQGCFPPRSSGSTPPAHVAWLNVHRHRGFDIWLTTQHPKLIDGSVRALVGKHQHYRRMFGGSRAVVYEWDSCSDSLAGMKTAVKTYWSYPKNIFKFYKSAEIHTKQSFKIPLYFFVPLLAIALGIYFVPKAASTLAHGISGKGLSAGADKSVSAVPSQPVAGQGGALVPVAVAPVVAVSEVVKVVYKGCISMRDRCACVTSVGVLVDAPDMCVDSSRDFGKLVNFEFVSPGDSRFPVEGSGAVVAAVPSKPVPPAAPAAVSSADGFGILGKAGPGVRVPAI